MTESDPQLNVGGGLVGDLFRDKYREITAALTREFSSANLDLIEDAIQEAMLKALHAWSVGEIPRNPGGWLFVAARRGTIDKLRARKRHADLLPDATLSSVAGEPGEHPLPLDPLENDLLKMVFVCCHPDLGWRSQLALMLKNLCALGNAEIASVLLSTPDAVKKTLARAKNRIRVRHIEFDLPDDASIQDRLDAVLRCIYLLFNEGYLAHGGDGLVVKSLCEEALNVVRILVRAQRLSERGKVCALASLVALQTARLPARVDAQGRLVRLADQQRSRWDAKLIAEGMTYLQLSTASSTRSAYHLQAAIAACHAVAASYETTDWPQILHYYDQLLELHPSPVVALNRTVAVAMTQGYAAALDALEALACDGSLSRYYLLPALRADYLRELGAREAAMENYNHALALVGDCASRQFLLDQLARCASFY